MKSQKKSYNTPLLAAGSFIKTQEGKWLLSEYMGVDSTLSLNSVEFQISFPELYENVIFDKPHN